MKILMVDSFTEFKRSIEVPEFLAKVYETNMLIAICEYVTVMDEYQFRSNEEGVKEILTRLSDTYIFEDLGFTGKNFGNWGYRVNGDIVALDYGYMYPIKGQEAALSCPKCSALLRYNPNFTEFRCSSNSCATKYRVMDIRRRMSLNMENFENRMISTLNNLEMPDFENVSFKTDRIIQ